MDNSSIKDLQTLLALELVQSIISCPSIKIKELNAIVALLIKANLDFDLSFTSASNRSAAEAILTVFIAPTMTVQFILAFGPLVAPPPI